MLAFDGCVRRGKVEEALRATSEVCLMSTCAESDHMYEYTVRFQLCLRSCANCDSQPRCGQSSSASRTFGAQQVHTAANALADHRLDANCMKKLLLQISTLIPTNAQVPCVQIPW